MKTKNFLKKVLKVVLVAAVSFGICFSSVSHNLYAVEIQDESIVCGLDELNRNSLWNWQVVVDKYSKMPKTLYGSLTNQYDVEQQKVAQKFLCDYLLSANIFGLVDNFVDYKMVQTIKMIGTYILYVQTYNNIPIEYSYLLVAVTSQKRISLVKSKIFNHLDINTNPQLGEAEAYNIAAEDAKGITDVVEPGVTELVIVPYKNNFLLAWKIQFKTDRFGGEINYIINDNGKILKKFHKKGHVLLRSKTEENSLLEEKEVVKTLKSLGNSNLITETKNLLEILLKYDQEPDKKIVSESIITADLNISGGENLLNILDILLKNNLLDEKLYYKFKHDIYKKKDDPLIQGKDKIDEKPKDNPINPIYSNQKNSPSPVSKPSFSSTQSDMLTMTQMQAQDIQNSVTSIYQMLALSLYQSFASSNTTASMKRWSMDILKMQQATSLNLNSAKAEKKCYDKWTQYIQS